MKIYPAMINLFGHAGGIFIYMIAKVAGGIANIHITRQELNSNIKSIMRPLFPQLDLDRIRIKPGSTLPANWFGRRARYVAITFGYTVYYTGKDLQNGNESLNVLMHELVHVEQFRKRDNSEVRFAGDYGKGYMHAGNYRQNPLEKEAFDFVNLHRLTES